MADRIYIPTFISSVDFQPARVLPHIYFFNGLKDCEPYYIQHYTDDTKTQVTSSLQQSFPYFDYYDGLVPSTGSNSLLFFNEQPAYGTTPTASLYTEYWDKYISLLYDPRTRLIDASAIIPLADYFAMELNDIVQWRGNYYHLRAINDYNLVDGTCKLQLLGPIIKDSLTLDIINCDFNFVSEVSQSVVPTTTLAPTTSTTTTPPLVYPTSGSLLRVEIPTNGGDNMIANDIEAWYLRPVSSAQPTPVSSSIVLVNDTTASLASNNVAELSSVLINGIPSGSTLGTIAVFYRFAETGSVTSTQEIGSGDYIDGRDGAPDPEEGVPQSYIFPRSSEIGTLWDDGDMYSAFDAAPFEKFTPTDTTIFGSTSWEQLPGTRNSTSSTAITAGVGMEDYKFLATSPTAPGVANGPSTEWRLVIFGSDNATNGGNYTQWRYGGSTTGTGQNIVRILAMGVWDRILNDTEVENVYDYWQANLR